MVTRHSKSAGPILVMALGVYGREGGIERINRRLLQALSQLQTGSGRSDVLAIALWDRKEDVVEAPPGVSLWGGNSGKLITFIKFVWSCISMRPQLVIFSHLLLAPLLLITRIFNPQAINVLLVYGREVWSSPSRWIRWLVARKVDKIVSISNYTSRAMQIQFNLPASQFLILPCAVDILHEGADFVANSPSRSKMGGKLLTVARLTSKAKDKNVENVILAMPVVLEVYPSVQYEIIGEGNLRPALEELVISMGLTSSILFRGQISEESVKRQSYSSSDVFILPSTGEGFGIVYLEAWEQGLPVIAGDQGAPAEIIRHGVDGLCVSPEPEAISKAIIQLLGNEPLRRSMGLAGRRRVEEHYSHQKFTERLAEILEELAIL